MSSPWQVRVYREQFTEPVSAMAWSNDEVSQFLAEIAEEHGPGTLVELVDPEGTVVASEAVVK
ncbi:hypothetical protein Ade02nite_20450 [Paractinoplanes deccanensis]|uniref:Uncharacterized protein n=1 Tax=Paractinoplanes deccanensis TaxID=113561 RepID=A0ABQ3Y070_9ACTN|nr:hypothetical protein [Actinoplanes deccanensis]GID73404.1 hypothetical protein Ade02nite_20450 [Actinoplanes deccanensis]